MTLHRIISALIMITIVIPVYFCICILVAIHFFFNGLHFENWQNLRADPQTMLVAESFGLQDSAVFKLWLLYIGTKNHFLSHFRNFKTLKF